MGEEYTRRRLLYGLAALGGTSLLKGGSTNAAEYRDGLDGRDGDEPNHKPAAVRKRDVEVTYPLATYEEHDGVYYVTMPVNVRFDLPAESAYDVVDVESIIRNARGWTRLVSLVDPYWPWGTVALPDTWNADGEELAQPIASYRKPVDPLGEEIGYHAYLWPVTEDGETVGVAAQVHKDVGTIQDHVGADYDEAAAALASAYEAAGWTVSPAEFDYGVGPRQRNRWGETGDMVIAPPDV